MARTAQIGALRVTLGINTAAFERGLMGARQALFRAGRQMQAVGKQMTTALSLPIALLGAGVLKAAGDFDQGMANVRAVLRPTADEFAALRDLAKELGATTKFTAREAADGMEMLARNGLKATHILGGAIQATLNLAAAAGADLAPAADVMTDIMINFRKRASDLNGVVDQMAGVLVSSKMGWEDYTAAVGQAAGVAGPMGMSLADMNAGLASTASSFASGEEAGTSFKGFLLRIAPAVKESAALIKQLGLNFFDSAGRIRSLAEIAEELRTKIGQLNKESQLRVLGQLFGQRTIRTAARLMEEGAAGIERWKKAIGDVSAEQMAQARMDSFWGSVRLLTSALENLAIAIADSGLLAWARAVVDKMTEMVRSLSQTSPAMLRWGTIVAGLVLVAGPLVVVLGLVAMGIAAIGAPIAGAIAAVIAITGVITAFWTEIQTAAKLIDNAFGDIFRAGKAWLIDKLSVVIEFVRLGIRGIAITARWVAEQLGLAVAKAGEMVGVTGADLEAVAARIKKAWAQAAADVAAESTTAADNIRKPIKTAVDALRPPVEGVRTMTMDAMGAMSQLATQAKTVFQQTRTPAEALTIQIGKLNQMFQRGLIDADTYARAVKSAKDKMTGAGELMRNIGQSFESAFVSAVTGAEKFSDALKGLLKDLLRIAAQKVFQQTIGTFFAGGGGLPGFAQGGSFAVGGSGGIDSQLVAFRATPREMVNVTKPGQDMGGGRGVTVVQNITFDASMTAADKAVFRAELERSRQMAVIEANRSVRESIRRDPNFLRA